MESTDRHSIRVSISLIFDSLFPLLVFTAYASNGIFPIHYVAMIFGLTLAVLVLFLKSESSKKGLITALFILTLISAAAGNCPIILIGVLFIFFLWRLQARTQNKDLTQMTTGQLIAFFLVFMSMFIFQLTYGVYPSEILIVYLILGFLLYSSGPFFSSYSGKKANLLFVKWTMLFSASFILIYFLAEPLRRIIMLIANQVNYGIIYLLLLTGLDISLPQVDEEAFESESSSVENMNETNPFERTDIEETVKIETLELIVLVVGIVIIVMLSKIIFSKFSQSTMKETNHDDTVTIERKKFKKTEPEKIRIPNHKVRKEILKIEQKAQLNEAHRFKSETVREWFSRLGFENAAYYAGIYEKVRYANENISEDELNAFEQFVKVFDKRMKSM
ncbi:hypothetical protein [Jeotgalibacillus salarius]|uniref:DUF4129 domain-containing protein n=1 Tax=Jeotgalibacillus salarius TaxID=546023 RepID=A0A4Y8LFJ8_9BACL|nr:hypothetical protein [Jeotgalibacillus salarius]TFE00333.1 hypothetical protein E2626_12700 [Jeotgalibacillus salarius]